MAVNSPPSNEASELYTLLLRFCAVSGMYRSSDLLWAAGALEQSLTQPDEGEFGKQACAYLRRQAEIQKEFEDRRNTR